MDVDLTTHLEKVHEYEKTDFRWKNLRTLVMKYVSGHKILDAGCGSGHMSLELLRSGFEVTSIDYSDELTSFTRNVIEKNGFFSNVLTLDLTKAETLGSNVFDFILCLDVIEHILDDELAIRNLHSVLNHSGCLIISVPAIRKLYGKRDEKMGHHRRYDKKELISLIQKAGFTIESVRYWNFIGVFPFFISEKIFHKPVYEGMRYSRKNNISIGINKILDLWFSTIENHLPLPVGLSLIVVCKKKPVTDKI